jgi:hypothetical protein
VERDRVVLERESDAKALTRTTCIGKVLSFAVWERKKEKHVAEQRESLVKVDDYAELLMSASASPCWVARELASIGGSRDDARRVALSRA